MSGYRTGGWFGMVLIGAENEESRNVLCSIYNRIPVSEGGKEVSVCCMSPESAEICKLASNCFRTTKISFANMIGDIADRSNGANKYDICDALKCDRSIGPICMTPGYGFGGPCYPRDNKALSLYAKSIGISPLIPSATDEYNDFHHNIMTEEQVKLQKEEYEFLDVTYKPNCAVPMIDKSPKLEVACALAKRGKKVKIVDRFSVILEVMKEYGDLFEYETSSSFHEKKVCDNPNGIY
jgi:nucleotide sugar dehydrogenase